VCRFSGHQHTVMVCARRSFLRYAVRYTLSVLNGLCPTFPVAVGSGASAGRSWRRPSRRCWCCPARRTCSYSATAWTRCPSTRCRSTACSMFRVTWVRCVHNMWRCCGCSVCSVWRACRDRAPKRCTHPLGNVRGDLSHSRWRQFREQIFAVPLFKSLFLTVTTEALGEHCTDENRVFFAALSLKTRANMPQLRNWVAAYPLGKTRPCSALSCSLIWFRSCMRVCQTYASEHRTCVWHLSFAYCKKPYH
jgi:hypothetical protein